MKHVLQLHIRLSAYNNRNVYVRIGFQILYLNFINDNNNMASTNIRLLYT